MAVTLRLSRAGTHKRPYFWIVASDSRKPRDGRYLEKLGTYDPLTKPRTVILKSDRINHWLDKGAKPSDAVRELLREQGSLKTRAQARAPQQESPEEAAPPA